MLSEWKAKRRLNEKRILSQNEIQKNIDTNLKPDLL